MSEEIRTSCRLAALPLNTSVNKKENYIFFSSGVHTVAAQGGFTFYKFVLKTFYKFLQATVSRPLAS